jgi:uncharacterized protein (DUF302 family)
MEGGVEMNQRATGIETIASRHSVDDTLERLNQLLRSKGVTLFTIIDHSGEAEKAGFQMPDTKVVIFGSPKAGTPVMLRAPLIAIDLPLKILIWQDSSAKVWISYTQPEFLQERYQLPADAMAPLAAVRALAGSIAQ